LCLKSQWFDQVKVNIPVWLVTGDATEFYTIMETSHPHKD